jgi:hypothetical protein
MGAPPSGLLPPPEAIWFKKGLYSERNPGIQPFRSKTPPFLNETPVFSLFVQKQPPF